MGFFGDLWSIILHGATASELAKEKEYYNQVMDQNLTQQARAQALALASSKRMWEMIGWGAMGVAVFAGGMMAFMAD